MCPEGGDLLWAKQDQAQGKREEYILEGSKIPLEVEIEKENLAIGTYLDLSKAFDTVNHPILLQKQELYGARHARKIQPWGFNDILKCGT